MKSIDLYAAYALGAMLARGVPDDTAIECAIEIAEGLGAAICAKHGHERERGEDVHGNVWASSCERCGD